MNFVSLRDAGDPIELAAAYDREGADEVVFLDITATSDDRATTIDMAARAAEELSIPYTVGGGFRDLAGMRQMVAAGADKVSINSAAIRRPQLIDEIARRFGRQVCVCAIDARHEDGEWYCYLKGGRERTGLTLFEWAKEAEARGAGEILFTSMDNDGVKNGYANDALAQLSADLSIPVIASGGAGTMEHFRDAFSTGHADAALAASVFHFGEIRIKELKAYLKKQNINVRT